MGTRPLGLGPVPVHVGAEHVHFDAVIVAPIQICIGSPEELLTQLRTHLLPGPVGSVRVDRERVRVSRATADAAENAG